MGIVWLASYPKSGNTWFRVFLANLLLELETPVEVNYLPFSNANFRFDLDRWAGLKTGNLTSAEIQALRPRIYAVRAERSKETVFLKLHDACTTVASGDLLISEQATQGVLYFVRNPLDVCVSFAHHSSWSIDTAIDIMADPDYHLGPGDRALGPYVKAHLGSWHQHVLGWIEEPRVPVHVVRYEDMHQTPLATFGAAVCFAGLSPSSEQIQEALTRSHFDVLKEQERTSGFLEKAMVSASFFRKGKVGSWRDVLTPQQVERLIQNHGEMMRRLGYLSAHGALTDCT